MLTRRVGSRKGKISYHHFTALENSTGSAQTINCLVAGCPSASHVWGVRARGRDRRYSCTCTAAAAAADRCDGGGGGGGEAVSFFNKMRKWGCTRPAALHMPWANGRPRVSNLPVTVGRAYWLALPACLRHSSLSRLECSSYMNMTMQQQRNWQVGKARPQSSSPRHASPRSERNALDASTLSVHDLSLAHAEVCQRLLQAEARIEVQMQALTEAAAETDRVHTLEQQVTVFNHRCEALEAELRVCRSHLEEQRAAVLARDEAWATHHSLEATVGQTVRLAVEDSSARAQTLAECQVELQKARAQTREKQQALDAARAEVTKWRDASTDAEERRAAIDTRCVALSSQIEDLRFRNKHLEGRERDWSTSAPPCSRHQPEALATPAHLPIVLCLCMLVRALRGVTAVVRALACTERERAALLREIDKNTTNAIVRREELYFTRTNMLKEQLRCIHARAPTLEQPARRVAVVVEHVHVCSACALVFEPRRGQCAVSSSASRCRSQSHPPLSRRTVIGLAPGGSSRRPLHRCRRRRCAPPPPPPHAPSRHVRRRSARRARGQPSHRRQPSSTASRHGVRVWSHRNPAHVRIHAFTFAACVAVRACVCVRTAPRSLDDPEVFEEQLLLEYRAAARAAHYIGAKPSSPPTSPTIQRLQSAVCGGERVADAVGIRNTASPHRRNQLYGNQS